ncbi:type II toxin-antitoxin system VapC family toxin [Rhodococcus sp. ARC_M6]|uniref:type II toxin-antitoxin system VapC family toxin n=1 Tax=Rhodococcus sp. ARC_M6 TaxID=2928852 RepID=UPI001FB44E91|nr:type II toxin-antitoxin system VapC family toxin [Rhodococcus sp. ARC_M6]MCJ0905500.1 type II toxin-antitoxin system VapC family toxin [Rhodococcus sp. ARC_M6]
MGSAVKSVLDTSILIANDVPPLDGELAISAVSLAELHFGLLVAASAEQRALRLQRLIAVERKFEPLPVDALVARSYGQLAAAVKEHGRKPQPRALDLMIAATAHAHNARLVTRNAEDLRGIEHLLRIDTV